MGVGAEKRKTIVTRNKSKHRAHDGGGEEEEGERGEPGKAQVVSSIETSTRKTSLSTNQHS